MTNAQMNMREGAIRKEHERGIVTMHLAHEDIGFLLARIDALKLVLQKHQCCQRDTDYDGNCDIHHDTSRRATAKGL